MSIGASLFLLAAGAILKYAVNDSVEAVDLQTVGVVLMVVGVIGLLISLLYMTQMTRRRDEPPVARDRDRY